MKQKDELYELIHSLTPSEKGYFKRTAQSDTNYIKLFTAIDNQKECYDENLLKKKLKGEKFIQHLAVSKKYLYDEILDVLVRYQAGEDIRNILRTHIQQVETLAKKGLYAHCRKILHKAMKLSEEYESLVFMQEIIYWEKYLTVYESFKNIDEQFTGLLKRELDVMEKMQLNVRYEMIFRRMFSFVSKHSQIRNDEDQLTVDEIMSDPLLKDLSNATTLAAKSFFVRTHVLFCKLTGDMQMAHEYCRKFIHIFEERPVLIKKMPKNYLEQYLLYLTSCINAGAEEEFIVQLERLRLTPEIFGFKTGDAESNVFFESFVFEMYFYFEKNNIKKALQILQNIEKHFFENEDKIRILSRANICYLAMRIHFTEENYSTALVWVNKFLNNKEFEVFSEQSFHARILNLILHYELGNPDFVESQFAATYRYLSKKQKPFEFEKAILSFLKRTTLGNSPQELHENFSVLKTKLEELENNPFEKAAIQKFPFIPYLEKKIAKSF